MTPKRVVNDCYNCVVYTEKLTKKLETLNNTKTTMSHVYTTNIDKAIKNAQKYIVKYNVSDELKQELTKILSKVTEILKEFKSREEFGQTKIPYYE